MKNVVAKFRNGMKLILIFHNKEHASFEIKSSRASIWEGAAMVTSLDFCKSVLD